MGKTVPSIANIAGRCYTYDPPWDSWVGWWFGIRYLLPYLGTVVGGRRGVENGPVGGGILIFPPGGRKHFLLQEGGRVP